MVESVKKTKKISKKTTGETSIDKSGEPSVKKPDGNVVRRRPRTRSQCEAEESSEEVRKNKKLWLLLFWPILTVLLFST